MLLSEVSCSHAEIEMHKGTDLKTYFKMIEIQRRCLIDPI